MTIEFEVLREGRVVLVNFPISYTMEDLREMNDAVNREVLSKAVGKVHTIADLSAVKQSPTNIISLSRNMIAGVSPNVGTMIVVTPDKSVTTVARTLIRVFPKLRFAVCTTVAEALEEADRLTAQE